MSEYTLQKIDSLLRIDHSYLTEEDKCYFMMTYFAGPGHFDKPGNDIISNLKKKLDRKQFPAEWAYKGRAIRRCAKLFQKAIDMSSLQGYTIVPIPPSKCKSDPMHDDRMCQVVNLFTEGYNLDVRDLFYLPNSIRASHEMKEKRHTVYDIEQFYVIDESLTSPPPKHILLVDDVITNGAHFKGLKNLLLKKFPKCSVDGLFICRRRPSDNIEQ